MKKRIISLLLCLVMCVTVPPITASANRLENALLEAEEIYIETLSYVESDDDEKNFTFHALDIFFSQYAI